ncbi:N-acylneuraminate cytidylyltransferase/CMP-N,N'-diacetyllegionaminic acid synthase [Paenibacillus taihuensis]|uniref:N-acylneuraminate cytidylyltransferase/CMP-N,N'-diacetyllegionaminic acid synthase n=1 Tax=Paenibacillus taihuensis TaxID=1156355 RepID=A0A3D9RX08_9BACL|nr:acylneuraminate cytidylyltransferase family protein [Paenibacillus taihuensis]REE84513.1 N-acylneuraminate cytidylyltransferase/CMP-N,N'-diacetyllegionaminic acid synthase [Paenibacillus taihuensis]
MKDLGRILAIVPARGGSKGILDKNIRQLGGKPLIAWTLEAARGSKYIDRCIVSTDSERIAEVAKGWGGDVPFLRPEYLARDDTPGMAPILHALDQFPEYETVVLLQPTSPFRLSRDIDDSIELFLSSDAHSVVSVSPVEKPIAWMYRVQEDGMMESVIKDKEILRRQDDSGTFVLNGAVYVSFIREVYKKESFLAGSILAHTMPKSRSLDIDHPIDLEWGELLLRQYGSPERFPH